MVCQFKREIKMKKIKVAVVGYGNIGRYVVEAIEASQDMEISGIIRRNPTDIPAEISSYRVVDSIEKLDNVDVAIVCSPSRAVESVASEILTLGINTVDSFDIHSKIVELKASLGKVAKEHNSVAVLSSGWDPGSDSVVRTLMEACAPRGVTYTNFGPGMSMGHSVVVKSIEGVKNALSMTIPTGSGVHRRMVYVELEPNVEIESVTKAIKSDDYFINDETHVKEVESVDTLLDMGHGTHIVRKGVAGKTHNQLFEFEMRITNPAVTAQVMVSAARASMRQKSGAYTLIEIAPIDFLFGDRDELINRLV